METFTLKRVPSFLEGGGEMGELTRCYNWSQTSLGEPDNWSQSLKTTLGILLHSAFPMFLFWGKDLLCFYNDAFRPSLGVEGKHPALGKKGKDVWPEIWEFIGPLIEKVMTTGEPVWFEDQLVPFYRNGRMEDIYWTFSYSPAYGDDGKIAGLFVTCTETTSQVNNIKKLEAAKQQFHDLVMQAPVAIAVFRGPDFIAEIANDAYLPLVGKTREQFVGKPLFESLPEIKATLEPIAKDLIITGNPFLANEFEIVINRFGKHETCYFNFIWKPLLESDETINGFMVVAQEITHQVLSRKKVEESETRFRLLADAMPQFVWAGDSNGNLYYFNQAVYDYSGLTAETITQSGWIEIVHPDDREENLQKWKHSVETGEDFVFHHRFKNKKGDYRWQLSRATPQKDSQGNIQMWIGTSTDIHDQKLFEEELKDSVSKSNEEIESSRQEILRSAERLSAVFNHSQSGMFTFSPVKNKQGEVIDFRFVITNPAFAAYVGQTPEILNGELGSKWFPGYLTNGVFDMYKLTYITGETQRKDVHYHVDQHDLYLDLMSTKVDEEVLVTFTDYTPLKRAQLQLEKYVQELKHSNANLEEFAYAASHDMKEPIRKIHFFTDRLKNQLEGRMTEEEKSTFLRIEKASTRMGNLIDDLLLYSHVTQRPLEKEAIDLNVKLSRVMEDLELDIQQTGTHVYFKDLPTIYGYRRQLQQLFQNLITNAIKYRKPGETPTIFISSEEINKNTAAMLGLSNSHKRYYKIKVKDNGIGFDQSDADRIFQMFQRLHGNSEYKGTGVGLAIAKKVVENHGGKIIAVSNPGQGAEFNIYLPAE